MQVSVMPRNKAIRFCHERHDFSSAIISIATPDEYYRSSPFCSNENGVKNICRLSFADAECANADCPDILNLISADQADTIARFVQTISKAYPDIRLIIHCDAGVSRSAGVAAAICKAVNGSDTQIFDNPYYKPNMRCYRYVLEAFSKQEANEK